MYSLSLGFRQHHPATKLPALPNPRVPLPLLLPYLLPLDDGERFLHQSIFFLAVGKYKPIRGGADSLIWSNISGSPPPASNKLTSTVKQMRALPFTTRVSGCSARSAWTAELTRDPCPLLGRGRVILAGQASTKYQMETDSQAGFHH